MFISYLDFIAAAALGAKKAYADAHSTPTILPPQSNLSQEAAGHRLPGHLLVQVLLDEVVMLIVPKLLVSLIAGTASFAESG